MAEENTPKETKKAKAKRFSIERTIRFTGGYEITPEDLEKNQKLVEQLKKNHSHLIKEV